MDDTLRKRLIDLADTLDAEIGPIIAGLCELPREAPSLLRPSRVLSLATDLADNLRRYAAQLAPEPSQSAPVVQ